MRQKFLRQKLRRGIPGHMHSANLVALFLLHLLMEQQDIVLSRDYLYEHIWGFNFETNSKSLDVYIGYLRKKLEAGGERRLIHTVRGVGYKFVAKE